jgi:hypothetical protein
MMFSYIRINCSRALDRNHSNGACRRTAFRAGLFRHGQPLGRRALAPGPTSRLRASHIGRYPAHLPLTDEEERNGPPQSASESHVFRADRSAPRPQHRHRVNLRGRPPLPLHHARRLRPARPRCGDPPGPRRMVSAHARAWLAAPLAAQSLARRKSRTGGSESAKTG